MRVVGTIHPKCNLLSAHKKSMDSSSDSSPEVNIDDSSVQHVDESSQDNPFSYTLRERSHDPDYRLSEHSSDSDSESVHIDKKRKLATSKKRKKSLLM